MPKQPDGWQKCPATSVSKKDRLIQLFKRQETLTQEGGRLDADWRALWDTAPFDPLVPDAMLEWLEARNELMEAIELRAEATGEAGSSAKRGA